MQSPRASCLVNSEIASSLLFCSSSVKQLINFQLPVHIDNEIERYIFNTIINFNSYQ